MLPAQARCEGLPELIEQEHYFIIHAARQSGKTTLLLDLAEQLNHSGDYYALYCSLEALQGVSEAEKAIPLVIDSLQLELEFHPQLNGQTFDDILNTGKYSTLLMRFLAYLRKSLDKPLVILFDEVDCLSNGALLSFLRQLRNGYVNRHRMPFAESIALVGMRNIRDYKAKVRDDTETLGSASPFNITKTSKTLRNFTQAEISELYAQHTHATRQSFPPEVVEQVYLQTQGQPWLSNAIAYELTLDETVQITPQQVEQAIQTIIQRRDTHIDSLMERLKEKRVQRVVEPMILGQATGYEWGDNDYDYVLNLGLLREASGKLIPANPIYSEIIVRALTASSQMEMERRDYPPHIPAYLQDGKLNMRRLLEDFQAFWRQHSESWVARYQYQEAAPHLILHAFLYRVINSGGKITREMAAGNGRLDLCLHYQGMNYPIELKIRYGEETYQEGQQQLLGYMDKLACVEGWLVVFDRRKSIAWEEKLFWRSESVEGKRVHVVGA